MGTSVFPSSGSVSWPLTVNSQPKLTGVADTANDSEPAAVVYPASGTEVAMIVASTFTDGDHYTGLVAQATTTEVNVWSQVDGSFGTTNMEIKTGSGGLALISSGGDVVLQGANVRALSDVQVDNGKAIKTDTTMAHTALLQAYDVDGAAYKTFVTLTNANVPTCTISQPAGATLVFIPPTADPHVVGALWNNAGTLTISAG